MKKISLREFKEICDSTSPSKYVLASDSQPDNRYNSTLRARLMYKTMLIALNPNVVCFKKEDDIVCLDRVKYVKISEKKLSLGTIYHIVCGDRSNDDRDISYAVVVSP